MPIPDAEVLAVNWVKSNSPLDALIDGRVATRLPKNPPMPFLRVQRVAGTVDDSEAPIDNAVLQFDSFGAEGDTTPAYESASLVARTLIEEAANFRGSVGSFGTIMGMTILEGPRRIEEPETGYARYMVEILLMSREGV